MDATLKVLAELVGALLIVALLAVDLWVSVRRRRLLVSLSAVLFLLFSGLVLARFVVVAG